jgi:hypothetical protein
MKKQRNSFTFVVPAIEFIIYFLYYQWCCVWSFDLFISKSGIRMGKV